MWPLDGRLFCRKCWLSYNWGKFGWSVKHEYAWKMPADWQRMQVREKFSASSPAPYPFHPFVSFHFSIDFECLYLNSVVAELCYNNLYSKIGRRLKVRAFWVQYAADEILFFSPFWIQFYFLIFNTRDF